MIETVIQLDGTPEKFNGAKLNRWIQASIPQAISEQQWSEIALETVMDLPNKVHVLDLQRKLIDTLLKREQWSYYLKAGHLYAILTRQELFGSKVVPSIKSVHEKLVEMRLMDDLGYNDFEYEVLEHAIDHTLDLLMPHYSLEQLRHKYSVSNSGTGEQYETPQLTYMRVAMAVFSKLRPVTVEDSIGYEADYSKRNRIQHVIGLYRQMSSKVLSQPTPNYNNFGTHHKGYASCCVIASGDNRWSLAAADHATYMMTTQSAGIGLNIMTRSVGDPVQGGRFLHRGKLPYLATYGKNIRANLQGGRGGAGTAYFNMYDSEAGVISGLRDTRAIDTKRNRDAHYAYLTNKFFAMKVAKGEKVFTWNIHSAPDLHKAFYSEDIKLFAKLYEKYENDPLFPKEYVDARELQLRALYQGLGTGTIYATSIDEMNRNTPFIDPIRSSNLCLEIAEPTEPYPYTRDAMKNLYSNDLIGVVDFQAVNQNGETNRYRMKATDVLRPQGHRKISAQDIEVGMVFDYYTETLTVEKINHIQREPEIALCSLAAINVTEELTEEQYAEAMYYALKTIDYAILENDYILPHVGVTAKRRMNAGVGIMGLGTHMARRKLAYNSKEGLKEIHRVAERHMYHAIYASIRISKERGLAPWIDRTKWPEGWTPMQTYNRAVDTLADFDYQYDWDKVSDDIKANGGLAHSCVVTLMPGESSSKALAALNSIYGMRDLVLIKNDADNTIRWAVPYGDDTENYMYQSMYDLTLKEQNHVYAVFQKFVDQSISADWFIDFTKKEGDDSDFTVSSSMLIEAELDRIKYGVKTRYYVNTKMPTGKGVMKTEGSVFDLIGGEQAQEQEQPSDTQLTDGAVENDNDRADCAGCSV